MPAWMTLPTWVLIDGHWYLLYWWVLALLPFVRPWDI